MTNELKNRLNIISKIRKKFLKEIDLFLFEKHLLKIKFLLTNCKEDKNFLKLYKRYAMISFYVLSLREHICDDDFLMENDRLDNNKYVVTEDVLNLYIDKNFKILKYFLDYIDNTDIDDIVDISKVFNDEFFSCYLVESL